MKEFSPNELTQAYESAPSQVRNLLDSGSFAPFITETAQKYSLSHMARHTLAGISRNAILRLISPEEFSSALAYIGIPASSIEEVMSEFRGHLTQGVAIEQTAGVNAPKEEYTSPAEPETPEPGVPENLPKPEPELSLPPAEAAAVNKTPTTLPSPATPVPPAVPSPKPPLEKKPAPVMSQIPIIPVAPQVIPSVAAPNHPPQARTMASDVEAMQTGQGSTPVKAPTLSQPARPAPPPVLEMPAAPPVAPKPAVEREPSMNTVHEDLKKYGIDPYREPIE